jgi:hypothetical protein
MLPPRDDHAAGSAPRRSNHAFDKTEGRFVESGLLRWLTDSKVDDPNLARSPSHIEPIHRGHDNIAVRTSVGIGQIEDSEGVAVGDLKRTTLGISHERNAAVYSKLTS